MDGEKRAAFKKATDRAYLVGLAIFIAYRTFFNTMMKKEWGITRNKTGEHAWLFLMLLLIALRMFYLRLYELRELLFGIFLIGLSAIVWKFSHTYWILMFPLVVVGAKDIDFAQILKVYLIVNGLVLGTAMILSLAGVITNLQYLRRVADASRPDGGYYVIRNSFGTTYPTTFSEFVFFMCAAGLYLRREKTNFLDVIFLAAVSGALLHFCDARTDCLCVGLLAASAFWLIVRKRFPDDLRNGLEKISVLLVPLMGILACVMSVCSVLYDAGNATWSRVNRILNNRFMLGRAGVDKYGFSLFGKWVKYHTTGGDVDEAKVTNYFNLDCSYVLVLINFGLLFFCVIIGMFTFFSWRAWRLRDTGLLLILAAIAMECVMENRLVQPQYDVFCLLLFASGGIGYSKRLE